MNGSTLVAGLAGAWLVVGLGVGGVLARRGQPGATALAAVLVWPAMLSLLAPGDLTPLGAGPFAPRIGFAFQALRAAFAEPSLAGLAEGARLETLEAALRRADERLAAVDRLLADPAVAEDASASRLIVARAHAAGTIEDVLRQLITVRVQLGLVALAGDTAPVRAHLAELGARAQALEEVGC